MGNRLSFVDRGRTTLYSANDVNQYTAVTAPTSPPSGAWSYDLRGNLLSDGTQRHKWDLENRLLSSNRPGTKKVGYTYDSRSRRTTRTQNGNTTYYIYEGWNVIAEYEGSAGVLPSTTKRHIWGTDLTETLQGAGGVGGLLRTDFATSTAAYFHYDGNGNVTELSNKKGRRSARYRYDVFGNTIVARGQQSEANQYRFSTKPFDETNGLYYYGYRFYDPVAGRWLNRDPLGEVGGVNIYLMVNNNVICLVDLLGLSCVPVVSNDSAVRASNTKSLPSLIGGRKIKSSISITVSGETMSAIGSAESNLGILISDDVSGYKSGRASISCACDDATGSCVATASSSSSGSDSPPRTDIQMSITASASGDSGTMSASVSASASNIFASLTAGGISFPSGQTVSSSGSKSVTVKCEKQ